MNQPALLRPAKYERHQPNHLPRWTLLLPRSSGDTRPPTPRRDLTYLINKGFKLFVYPAGDLVINDQHPIAIPEIGVHGLGRTLCAQTGWRPVPR